MTGNNFGNVVLPWVLYGWSIINYSKTYIRNMQIIENRVYMQLLWAPMYTPECTHRGKEGSSMMQSRIMENQLKYMKYIQYKM